MRPKQSQIVNYLRCQSGSKYPSKYCVSNCPHFDKLARFTSMIRMLMYCIIKSMAWQSAHLLVMVVVLGDLL